MILRYTNISTLISLEYSPDFKICKYFLHVYFVQVRKIKAIYHTMNMFNLDVTHKCLIAECWCPVADLDQIQDALKRGTVRII